MIKDILDEHKIPYLVPDEFETNHNKIFSSRYLFGIL